MIRLMGAETEYALAGVDGRGGPLRVENLAGQFLELAKQQLTHLPDLHGNGMYLTNGARLYIDCGNHPEMSTPECTDPRDVVRYQLAGDLLLAELGELLETRLGAGAQVMLGKGNVDYSGAQTTWGSHESYCHRAAPQRLSAEIIPHLVTRIVYTGAGGFDSLAPGLEFTISPRAPHMQQVISHQSTVSRGIFHTKDEPLSGHSYHRLHLLCGESLCSETSAWLRFGTTALVVAMIEAGVCRGDYVALQDPLAALHTIAGDAQCAARVRLADGRKLSAVEVQRHYLEQAEAHLDADFMPDWADEVCLMWRAVLEMLELGRIYLATILDWAIRRELYEARARRRGFTWQALADWSAVLRRLSLKVDAKQHGQSRYSVAWLFGSASPAAEMVGLLRPVLQSKGLDWEQLDDFMRLREELFEIDQRFSLIGRRSLFGALDRAGKLAHHVAGLDDVALAATEPPPLGRARLRGNAVRDLAHNKNRCRCDWQGVWDYSRGLMLDLSDPLAEEEKWSRLNEQETDSMSLLNMLTRQRS